MEAESGFVIQVVEDGEVIDQVPLPMGVSRIGPSDESLVRVASKARALLTLGSRGRLLVNDLGGSPAVTVRGTRAVDSLARVDEPIDVDGVTLVMRDVAVLEREARAAHEARAAEDAEAAAQAEAAAREAEAAERAAQAALERRRKLRDAVWESEAKGAALDRAAETAAAETKAAEEKAAAEAREAEVAEVMAAAPTWSFLPVAWVRWAAKGALLGAWVSALEAMDVLQLPASEAAGWLGLTPAIWNGMVYMGAIGLVVQLLVVTLLMPRWSADQWRTVRLINLLPLDLLISFFADLLLILVFGVVGVILALTIGWVFMFMGAEEGFDTLIAWLTWLCVGIGGLVFAVIHLIPMVPDGAPGSRLAKLPIRPWRIGLEYVVAAALVPVATKALLMSGGPPVLDWLVGALGVVAFLAILPTAVAAGTAAAGGTFVYVTTQAVTASITMVTASVGTLGAVGALGGAFFVLVGGFIIIGGAGLFITDTFGPGVELALSAVMALCAAAYGVFLVPLAVGALVERHNQTVGLGLLVLLTAALGGLMVMIPSM